MPESLSMRLNRQDRTWLVLRRVAADGTITRVSYPVFSGAGEHRNNPDSTSLADAGPLPTGRYYVVDRPTGGRLGPARDWITGRDKWFALFRDDGRINDQTMVNGVRRGEFRMHPGSRSVGCVTFVHEQQFNELRAILLNTTTATIPNTSIQYYGLLQVT
jgi:hypothetical protein